MAEGRFAPTVLLVAPPSAFAAEARTALLEAGFPVAAARTGSEARGRAARADTPLVVQSLFLPTEDGLELLADLRVALPSASIIAVTASGALNRAAHAMRGGAFDYLVQPLERWRLVAAVRNALAARAVPAHDLSDAPGLLGASAAMTAARADVARLARAGAPVLISAERGSGRTACARALHAASLRARGPFVRVDCAAGDEAGADARLFGEDGAFAEAEGGTLMLDGLSQAGPSLQGRLLRLMQTGALRPTGEGAARRIDVRLICATRRDLAAEGRAGRFREDLSYRLAAAQVRLPPLRERPEDVPLLIACALRLAGPARGAGRPITLHPEVRRAFLSHAWPGNVRELFDTVRGAAARCGGAEITAAMLPASFFIRTRPPPPPAPVAEAAQNDGFALPPAQMPSAPFAPLRLRVAPLVGARLADVEAALIEATLGRCGGAVPAAARMLGLAPSTLYRKLAAGRGAAAAGDAEGLAMAGVPGERVD